MCIISGKERCVIALKRLDNCAATEGLDNTELGAQLPLRGSGTAHNGPGANDGFAAGYVDPVEDVDTGVEVRGVNLDALAQLDVVVALVPQQKAGFLARKLPELGCFDRTPSKTLPIPPSTQTYAAELSGLARLSSVVTRRTPRPEQECSVFFGGHKCKGRENRPSCID